MPHIFRKLCKGKDEKTNMEVARMVTKKAKLAVTAVLIAACACA